MKVNGVIDGFLKWAGLSTIPWLSADFYARVSVVIASVWNLVGFYMLMVLAGLSQISPELYEAARIEGAAKWQRFWHITLPMLRPSILLIVILAMVHATQAFETILLLTDGGPGSATRRRRLPSRPTAPSPRPTGTRARACPARARARPQAGGRAAA